ncbi:MAG: nuclear transport factor 2 family protein [Rhodospirillaceae bacterium]|nr:nuclear transport factor 2 family protein [Rhodospirillaceae bacterium]
MTSFNSLLKDFAAAVEVGDGTALAQLFTEDGVYDDIFYGEFHGRKAIKDMLERLFWRDGKDFLWEFRNPAATDTIGYAQWLFSYTSGTRHNDGKRCGFEGVGIYHLRSGLIARYEDQCNAVTPLREMGVPLDVIDRMAGEWRHKFLARDGADRHMKFGAL